MKNSFAACDYRLGKVAAAVVAIFLLNILPLWGLFLSAGITRILFGLSLSIRLLSFAEGGRRSGLSPFLCFWSLFTPYLTGYILLKATYTTIKNGGIEWRGTFYPLRQLKENNLRING